MIFPIVVIISRALGAAFLVLHVVVAWALFQSSLLPYVPDGTHRHFWQQ